MGGASAVNYLVGLIRVKIVAVLLGPAGVGMVSLFTSTVGMIGTVTNFGIASSGVREVAQAFSAEDQQRMARTVITLRRACWLTGLLGWAVTALLAPWLSEWVFGDSMHAWAIGLLGVTLLLGAASAGQMALVQGIRRIGDIARANVYGAMINTVVAIALYAWLGTKGIVPVLVSTALVTLLISWCFAKRVRVESVALSWRESVMGARQLAGLGMAFMWSGVMMAGLDIFIRALITREQGIEAAGLYQAAWSLSGLFAGFILSAMGTDFYPRLAGVIHDHAQARKVVNEQMEIGILLAMPGLMGTLAFSPWLLTIFYSKEFQPGAELLPWFVLGIYGRVLSWPLGFIQLAKGSSRIFAMTETLFVLMQVGLVWCIVPRLGIRGAGYAFAASYFLYTLAMTFVARFLIDFRLERRLKKFLSISALLITAGLGSKFFSYENLSFVICMIITLIAAFLSMRELSGRLGYKKKLSKFFFNLTDAIKDRR